MDTVTLHGKVYERSAIVAKRHGYTADYLGQLSRDGKVDAELVGRSWYVQSDSVKQYKEGLDEISSSPDSGSTTGDSDSHEIPIHTQSSPEEASDDEIDVDNLDAGVDEIDLEIKVSCPDNVPDSSLDGIEKTNAGIAEQSTTVSVAKKEHLQKSKNTKNGDSVQQSYSRWNRAAYEPDNTELSPEVRKDNEQLDAEPTAFDDSNASRLRVHTTTDQYSIVASKLPTVRLRGKVKVDPHEPDQSQAEYKLSHGLTRKRIADINQKQSAVLSESVSSHEQDTAQPQAQEQQDSAEGGYFETDVSTEKEAVHLSSYLLGAVVFLASIVAVVSIMLLQSTFTYDAATDTGHSGWGIAEISASWEQVLNLAEDTW